jgi:hypothetical protein
MTILPCAIASPLGPRVAMALSASSAIEDAVSNPKPVVRWFKDYRVVEK